MPPVNQGSRTALITWTVVTSFLFITATIFAIYFYVESSRVTELNATRSKQYNDIVAEGAVTSAEVAAMKELKNKPENNYNPSATVFDVAMERAARGTKMIAGTSVTSPEAALASATAELGKATEKTKAVGVKLSADNLVTAVKLLTDAVVQRSTEAENARKTAAEASAQLEQNTKNTQDQIKLLTEELARVNADKQASDSSVTAMTAAKDSQLQQSADEINSRLKLTQETLDKANIDIAEKARQLAEKDKEISRVQDKLKDIRPDVNKPVLRAGDGRIVRIPGGGICFIDLGRGEQIIPGMTFEVYDRLEGIPPVGDPGNDDNLPRGKASIEVTRVGETSSECRIVANRPGSGLVEGDIVANLVYDRNTKNKFLVYGSFDLAQSGKPSPQDGEIVKRLVTQWGGEILPDINVDTDFVVLGKEPVIPTLTAEEREDPIQKAIYDRAVAEGEAYSDISAKARDYKIPILNQNRFLYMIGYYDQAKR